MSRWRSVSLGSARGTCGSCRQEADLTLREAGYRRRWRDRLTGRVDARVDRRVTSSASGQTYPVRSGGPRAPRRRGRPGD